MPAATPPAVPSSPATRGADGDAPAFSPLYQQIKGLITRSLQAGEWRPGEAIPSEMELAGRFKVSQGTVRKAIDELATDNLLVRRQGKGTFVATHAAQHMPYRFLKLMPDQGNTTSEGPAQRDIIIALAQNSANLQNLDWTLFRGFQAVAEYADHERVYRKTKKGPAEDARAMAIMGGTAQKLKDNFLTLTLGGQRRDRVTAEATSPEGTADSGASLRNVQPFLRD